MRIFPSKCMCSLLGLTLALAAVWPATAGQAGDASLQKAQALDEKNRRYFTDLPVRAHDGQEARFYSDLLKNKIVAISFFYTNCPTAQASQSTLSKVQHLLGEELGKDILLLSVSVDPERDSVESVRKYAEKYGPKPGWRFLTGKKENMDIINSKLGNRNQNPEFHLQVFLLGNLKTGQWMRLPETAPADAVTAGLHKLLPAK
jgi:cytochrome oxidase Cu insertion factor (SCO1/SenC/PrrC family)